MDTLVINEKDYKKIIETAINVSIIGVLILCQGLVPIRAEKIAQVTAPDFDTGQIKQKILNEVSMQEREKNFNIMAENKYKGSAIYDITKGVKHIKITKYYSGRPVKINVVEIDLKLAKDLEVTKKLPIFAA